MYKLPPVTSCIKGNISNLHHSPMKYFLSPFYRRRMWHSQRNAQDLSSSVLHDLPVYGLNKQPFSKCHPTSRAALLPSTHQSRSGLEGRACRKEALHFLKHLHLGLGLHYDHYCPYFFFFFGSLSNPLFLLYSFSPGFLFSSDDRYNIFGNFDALEYNLKIKRR